MFDAPDPAPIGLDALLAVPADDWPGLRFTTIAALEVLVGDWPVQRVWEDPAASPAPARTSLRIWRQQEDFIVSHAAMDAAMAGMLLAMSV